MSSGSKIASLSTSTQSMASQTEAVDSGSLGAGEEIERGWFCASRLTSGTTFPTIIISSSAAPDMRTVTVGFALSPGGVSIDWSNLYLIASIALMSDL